MIEPLEVEAQHAARSRASGNVLAFLQPMPNRVDSNVPTLPLANFSIATNASSIGRSGMKVRVVAIPSDTLH